MAAIAARFALAGLVCSLPLAAAEPKAADAKAPAASAPATAARAPNAPAANASGVVLVEQAGKVVALGTVLDGDGRILTSASRLNARFPVFVRYADGKLELARAGHSDAARDLALLVPKTGRWRRGLKAARALAPTAGKERNGFSVGANRAVLASSRQLKPGTGRGIALEPAPKLEDLGGPIVDARGDAVAIVVSGCGGAGTPAPCSAPPVALPVTEIRAFLRALPAEAEFTPPWLGVSGVSVDTGVVRGLHVTELDAGSPAAQAGLRAGTDLAASDVLVAVAGEPVPTTTALRAALTRHIAGARIDLLIYGKDGYRVVATRLADRPAGQNAGARSSNVTPSSAAPAAGSKAK